MVLVMNRKRLTWKDKAGDISNLKERPNNSINDVGLTG